ncbi:class I SAM-dependent methyltransferase [Anaerophaga thermohalophila]|jgi:ubiquinone/menaquinone biosynthesis C-methylase UbiE|uniref:class I SAM-dependent methyltransferase n=1 Tax=Anaerophaga thermohalophila TaxID=177400 RepID=UPI000237C826|nr:class I SAM-dependent methyltransferase [Anaerophaga thermohalophila]
MNESKKIKNSVGRNILDATCGSKMMWFDKDNPDVLFADKRTERHTLCDGRALEINPDIKMDFTDMPFDDNTFNLVVFDPPHLKSLGKKSWLALKYGYLLPTWEADLKAGFDECMRVLKPNGVLIFKWNENQIKVSKIIEVISAKPLFGHTTGRNSQTIWMTFMKM